MNNDDKIASIEMCFNQIISLVDLILEANSFSIPNALTIRDIAENGLKNFVQK